LIGPGRVLEVLREEGASGLWWRGLGVTVYRRLLIVSRRIGEGPREEPTAGELEFGWLDQGELGAYGRLRPGMREEAARRLRAGQRCFVGRRSGELVHARWFARGEAEMPYLGLAFELPEGVAYVYDVFTAPASRGARISAAAPRFERIVREHGTEVILGTVMPGNAQGLGLVRGAGYEPLGTIGSLRLGPVRKPVRRAMPRGYLGPARRFSPSL
jgi:hypothetical protein